MAMNVINSSGNINIPHGISAWFKKDWTGEWLELGDMVIDGVALSPEFVDFESVRAGIRAIRKRILTNRAASVSATLNEPSIVNFQRLLYGGDISSSQSVTLQEGRPITVESDSNGTYVDVGSIEGNETWSNISVTGIFEDTDVLEGTEITPTNAVPDTNGFVYFSATSVSEGDTVYVALRNDRSSRHGDPADAGICVNRSYADRDPFELVGRRAVYTEQQTLHYGVRILARLPECEIEAVDLLDPFVTYI